jgi:hypothetical protein
MSTRQIFISYEQTDEAFAVQLTEDLRASRATVWLDIHNAERGRYWSRSIERALSESNMMIVLLSPEALESAHVTVEWMAYLDARRPMIPVMVRPCDPPGPLRTRRPVDFVRDYPRAFHLLSSRLLEYSVRIGRQDPVIWDEVREFREEQPESPSNDLEDEDIAATGLRRMVGNLKDVLWRRP